METTIRRKVKAKVLEEIFDNCTSFSVRYFNASNFIESEYSPENIYSYEIKIRHAEEANARKLFDDEVRRVKKSFKR